MSPATPDTAGRVTTVEVFFDVVFVFTATQLAHVPSHDTTWAGLTSVAIPAASGDTATPAPPARSSWRSRCPPSPAPGRAHRDVAVSRPAART